LGPSYEFGGGPGEDSGVCWVTSWEGSVSFDSIHPLGQANASTPYKPHTRKGDCGQQTREALFIRLEENSLPTCDIEVLVAL
jgi:hypothetical protein